MAKELYKILPKWVPNMLGVDPQASPEERDRQTLDRVIPVMDNALHPAVKRKSKYRPRKEGLEKVYPNRYKQQPSKPPRTPQEEQGMSDTRGSETPGSSTPAKTNAGEGRAMDAADKHRPGAGYPEGVVRPMDYETNPGKVQPPRSGGSGGSEDRVSPTGVVQRGLKLGGINELYASLNKAGQMTAGDLPEASKYLSVALPATPKSGSPDTPQQEPLDQGVGRQALPQNFYDTLGGGTAETPKTGLRNTNVDFNKGGEFTVPDSTDTISVPRTMPDSTGGNPSNPQDGTSSKPDRVDRMRQLPVFQGVNGTEFGGEEPDDSSLVSPMYANADRNKARAAFLDPNNKGYSSIRARDRSMGTFDQNGTGVINIGGKLYEFNDGMSADARFARSAGLNSNEEAQAFLEKYVKTQVQAADPETPEEPSTEKPDSSATADTPEALATSQTTVPSSNGRTNFTVQQNQIPSANASQAEWDKYFKSVDSGQLTRMP